MERKIIGKFYATAFDETIYTFIVYEDGIACPNLGVERIKRVVLNPKFELISYDHKVYMMPIKVGYQAGLIKTYDIDKQLFKYMRLKGMLYYSTDMAYLYDFDDKKGFDAEFNKTPFKRVKDKNKILRKQKQGVFN